MDNALGVGVGEARATSTATVRASRSGVGPGEPGLERLAAEELQDEVRPLLAAADVIQGDEVRVLSRATTSASRWSLSASASARPARMSLKATCRPSSWSLASQTTPKPPRPSSSQELEAAHHRPGTQDASGRAAALVGGASELGGGPRASPAGVSRWPEWPRALASWSPSSLTGAPNRPWISS